MTSSKNNSPRTWLPSTMYCKSHPRCTILLGLLSPVTIKTKLLIQDLWQQQPEWDEPLPHELNTQWHNITNDIKEATTIILPRRCLMTKNTSWSGLHSWWIVFPYRSQQPLVLDQTLRWHCQHRYSLSCLWLQVSCSCLRGSKVLHLAKMEKPFPSKNDTIYVPTGHPWKWTK